MTLNFESETESIFFSPYYINRNKRLLKLGAALWMAPEVLNGMASSEASDAVSERNTTEDGMQGKIRRGGESEGCGQTCSDIERKSGFSS